MPLPIYGPPDNGNIGGAPPQVQTPFPVTSVNSKTGAVVLGAADLGLGNVNNTSDANKPVSTATAALVSGLQTQVNALAANGGSGAGADALLD